MKRFQVIAGYLIAGAASAGITCLFILVFVLFSQVAETGSAADWVASVANVVMAITAVLAFVVARSWLPQLTTQEGYKEAIRLVNDQYIQLGPDNTLGLRVDCAMQAYRAQIQSSTSSKIDSYLDTINSLTISLYEAEAVLKEIRETQFRLNTYGLTIHYVYAPSVDDMIKAFELAQASARLLCELLLNDANLRYQANIPPQHYSSLNGLAMALALNKGETAKGAEEQYQNVTEYLANMVESHQIVFSRHPPVGKLFCFRK